jgi:hypothetical protein
MEGVAAPEGFDAELYLRLAGERNLLTGDGGGSDTPPLAAAAHALVAIGAMPAEMARAVLADYDLAQACREDLGDPRPGPTAPATPEVIGGLRAVPCGRVIEQPWGELRIEFIVFGEQATALHVRLRLKADRPTPASAFDLASGPPVSSGFPQTLTLADDHGIVTDARFDRDGRAIQWSGQYVTRRPLARDAAWVEVLGERIGLAGQAAVAARVRTEPLTEPDPARRYLRTVLASTSVFDDDCPAQAAVAALIAAGTLAGDDLEVSAAQAVLTWQSHGPNGPPGYGPLPEPWRSLRPLGDDGPAGLLVVGVVTPEFDGMTIAVLALESEADEFSIAVEIAPGVPLSREGVDEPILSWWAADDRGHHYLGHPGEWESRPQRAAGRVDFTAPLDPAATVLDLSPSTAAARAVIRIPLDWAG